MKSTLTTATIRHAFISPLPVEIFDPLPAVVVHYTDGTSEELFTFFPDEISFTEAEFVGLTRDEAIALKFKKDKAFLQS